MDTTLIVTAHKLTKIDDLNQVKRNITNVGGKIAGVVLNKIPTAKKVTRITTKMQWLLQKEEITR